MRAFLDANVFVSYLLSPTGGTPPPVVARAGLAGAFDLLVSRNVLIELRTRTTTKPSLSARISATAAAELTALLAEVAEVVPEIPEPFPAIGWDRDDDYLIAHALIARADYLVSGDDDLLSLGQIETVRIVSPAQFLAILRDARRL